MTAGIILLNFGEPADPSLRSVTEYLVRIFTANMDLDVEISGSEKRQRGLELARRRAPSLLQDYQSIGGSPLSRQSAAQARALESELHRRGWDARAYVGMQFTEPTIDQAARRAADEGVELLIGLPVYPLCGHSTTIAALETLAEAVRQGGWALPLREISGWHRHPGYLELRADAVRLYATHSGLDLTDPHTRLVFSAHGTPTQFLREGSGYDRYVREWCRALAGQLGVGDYSLGFQNHANRGIEWTQPEVQQVIRQLETDRVVVDAVSFMHEQSETLVELDIELREVAEEAGLEFHRVPIPHDDPRFTSVLADLVVPLLGDRGAKEPVNFRYAPCRCRAGADTVCLNVDDGEDPSPSAPTSGWRKQFTT